MSNLAKIFQQTTFQILGKIITSFSTFIILGLVARNYQEAGLGIFTLALTYLSMFNLLGDFGFNAHLLKKIANSKFQTAWQKLLGTRLIWSVLLMILALITLPFWPFSTTNFSHSVIFGSLAILGSGVFISCNLIFQGKLRYDLSVLASSLGTAVYLLLLFLFSQNKLPFVYLTIPFGLSWIVIGLTSLILVKRFVNFTPFFDFKFAKDLIKNSWPIAATLALNVVYFRADSFMIAVFKTQTEVGIYNLAYSIFQSALVLPTFIMNAYYPLMLKSLSGIKWVGLGLLGLAVFGTIAFIIFAPLAVKLLTGGGFVGSAQSLQILSLGFPAYFLSSLLMWLMISKGEYKKMFVIYFFGLLVNLILNFVYIPQYSFWAASYITVISEYLILTTQIIYFRGILLR